MKNWFFFKFRLCRNREVEIRNRNRNLVSKSEISKSKSWFRGITSIYDISVSFLVMHNVLTKIIPRMNSWTNIISAMINSLISGFSLLTLMSKPLARLINKLVIVIEFNTNPIIADPIPINVIEMNRFILKLKSDIILDISWSNAISQKRCVLFQILNCFIKFSPSELSLLGEQF